MLPTPTYLGTLRALSPLRTHSAQGAAVARACLETSVPSGGSTLVFLWEMTPPLLHALEQCRSDKDGLVTLARWLRANSRLKLELFGREGSCLRGELLGAEWVEAWGERSGPTPCSAPARVESQGQRAEERSRHTSLCCWIQPCLKQVWTCQFPRQFVNLPHPLHL